MKLLTLSARRKAKTPNTSRSSCKSPSSCSPPDQPTSTLRSTRQVRPATVLHLPICHTKVMVCKLLMSSPSILPTHKKTQLIHQNSNFEPKTNKKSNRLPIFKLFSSLAKNSLTFFDKKTPRELLKNDQQAEECIKTMFAMLKVSIKVSFFSLKCLEKDLKMTKIYFLVIRHTKKKLLNVLYLLSKRKEWICRPKKFRHFRGVMKVMYIIYPTQRIFARQKYKY